MCSLDYVTHVVLCLTLFYVALCINPFTVVIVKLHPTLRQTPPLLFYTSIQAELVCRGLFLYHTCLSMCLDPAIIEILFPRIVRTRSAVSVFFKKN